MVKARTDRKAPAISVLAAIGGRRDPSHWKSARTTTSSSAGNEAFRRRIKIQAVLPDAETAPMLF